MWKPISQNVLKEYDIFGPGRAKMVLLDPQKVKERVLRIPLVKKWAPGMQYRLLADPFPVTHLHPATNPTVKGWIWFPQSGREIGVVGFLSPT